MIWDKRRTISNPVTNINTKDLAKFLTDGIIRGDARQRGMNVKDYSYETFKSYSFKPFIDKMIEKYAVAWLIKCMTKYDEAYFHKIMTGSYYSQVDGKWHHGFDFIGDWKRNHPRMMYFFLKGAKFFVAKNQDIISFDSMAYTQKVVAVVNNLGWKVYPNEVQDINDTIGQIIQMIVS